MTKPLIEDTRWAVTAGGSESTNVSVPDGSLKDDGYPDDAIPDAKDWNFWHRKAHAWFQYLNNGVFSGNTSVAGDLSVDGAALSITPTVFTVSGGLCTITGHGRRTGDGPFHTSNVGGALPTGLSAGVDYWLIVANANVFQFASSFANALAGTNIPLSTDGTGTQTLSSTSSTLSASDLTVDRNATVNGSATITGKVFHEIPWQHSIGFALPDAAASLSLGVAGTTATRLALLGSTGDNDLPLMIPVGMITRWSVTLNKASAAGTITARLYESTNASGAGPTQIGSTQSNGANAPGAITLGQTGVNFQMTLGREYFIVVNGGGTTGDMVTSYFAATTGI